MDFTILERMSLIGALPVQENFLTLQIINSIKEKMLPTDEEIKNLNIHDTLDGMTRWDEKASAGYISELPFSEAEEAYVAEILKGLNEKRELHAGLFTLYDKFVEAKR